MEINKLYTIKWRDCMWQNGWCTEQMIKKHIEEYVELELSGYFVYEDEEWYAFATTPRYFDQWLSITFLPKKAVISIRQLDV